MLISVRKNEGLLLLGRLFNRLNLETEYIVTICNRIIDELYTLNPDIDIEKYFDDYEIMYYLYDDILERIMSIDKLYSENILMIQSITMNVFEQLLNLYVKYGSIESVEYIIGNYMYINIGKDCKCM